MLYQNVRGLRTKCLEFNTAISTCNCDVIVLTETWFSNDISDREYFLDDFIVYRMDRNFVDTSVSRGGGVLIAVRNEFVTTRVDLSILSSTFPTIDVVGVSLGLANKIIFVSVYIPPDTSFADFGAFFDVLSTVDAFVNSKVFLVGDFNVPSWSCNATCRYFKTLYNFGEFCDLTQYNSIINFNNRLLDLVFSNIQCSVSRCLEPLVKEDPHHPCLFVKIRSDTSYKNFEQNNTHSYNFKKANFPLLYDALLNVDWTVLHNTKDTDDMCTEFYNIIYKLFDSYVPCYKVPNSCRRKYPIWFDNEIITCLKNKTHFHNKFKQSGTTTHYESFKYYRNHSKILIKNAYQRYLSNLENSFEQDPTKFWSFIQSKKGKTRIPGVVTFKNCHYDTPDDIVNVFSDYFGSVYRTSNQPGIGDMSQKTNNITISLPNFEVNDIVKLLKMSKNTSTSGYDGIPSFLLRDCASVFAIPLSIIFNSIFTSAQFPSIWKNTYITPVLKKGDPALVENYRPIALLCNFSKIFESLLFSHIYNSSHHYLSAHQHGFMKKRSTNTNLVLFTQFTSEILDHRGQVDALYLDFKKAFDQIDLYILLNKLSRFGICDHLLLLFKTYLFDRKNFVTHRNFKSKPIIPASGVPQGSNLGPLLFLIFIDDITNIIDSNKLLYADDIKIFRQINSLSDCQILQRDIDNILLWCKENNLDLNVSKCNVVRFTRKKLIINFEYKINDFVLSSLETVRDLGVIFDSKLMFADHINSIVSNCFRTLGFVCRNCRDFSNAKTLIILYLSLIRSRLEYCAVVWSPIYNIYILDLENVQRRFLKFVSYFVDGVYPDRGIDNNLLLMRFDVQSLQVRRNSLFLKFLYGLLHNKIDCPFLLCQLNFKVPRLESRSTDVFYCRQSRSNLLDKSPISQMCSIFNSINGNVDIYFDSINRILQCLFQL